MFSFYYAFITTKINLLKTETLTLLLNLFKKNLILYVWTFFVHGFETNDLL